MTTLEPSFSHAPQNRTFGPVPSCSTELVLFTIFFAECGNLGLGRYRRSKSGHRPFWHFRFYDDPCQVRCRWKAKGMGFHMQQKPPFYVHPEASYWLPKLELFHMLKCTAHQILVNTPLCIAALCKNYCKQY